MLSRLECLTLLEDDIVKKTTTAEMMARDSCDQNDTHAIRLQARSRLLETEYRCLLTLHFNAWASVEHTTTEAPHYGKCRQTASLGAGWGLACMPLSTKRHKGPQGSGLRPDAIRLLRHCAFNSPSCRLCCHLSIAGTLCSITVSQTETHRSSAMSMVCRTPWCHGNLG